MRERSPDPQSFTPLRPIALLILTVLGSGDRHGYGIRKDILEQTNGRVAIEAGNLYRHVRSLEEDGLVTESVPRGGEGDERRIYYRLTPLGRRVLAAELQRLRSLVRYAEERGLIARSRA